MANKMLFMDPEHMRFYSNVTNCLPHLGIQQKVFFYVMGLAYETRQHITDLYDFTRNRITPKGLEGAGWQTLGTRQVCYMAYNLFSGYCDKRQADGYTPYFLFCSYYAPYFVFAIHMLYEDCLPGPQLEMCLNLG